MPTPTRPKVVITITPKKTQPSQKMLPRERKKAC